MSVITYQYINSLTGRRDSSLLHYGIGYDELDSIKAITEAAGPRGLELFEMRVDSGEDADIYSDAPPQGVQKG